MQVVDGVSGHRAAVVNGGIEVGKIIHEAVHPHIDFPVQDKAQTTLGGMFHEQYGSPLEVIVEHKRLGEEYDTGLKIERHD